MTQNTETQKPASVKQSVLEVRPCTYSWPDRDSCCCSSKPLQPALSAEGSGVLIRRCGNRMKSLQGARALLMQGRDRQ